MKIRQGFTLIELLVVIAIIALLMGILIPTLNRAREMGKRAVCLGNLKSLTLGWILYADSNNDRLVNADVGQNSSLHKNEPSWILNDTRVSLERQKQCIMGGAMWPYVSTLESYKCPTTPKVNFSGGTEVTNTARSYSFVDPMNAANSLDSDDKMFKTRMSIPQPAKRVVMLDDGGFGYNILGAWGIWIRQWQWNDPPVIQHSNGTQWAFADGHADYHKWEEKETLEFARQGISNGGGFVGSRDLMWTGKAVWGNSAAQWYSSNN